MTKSVMELELDSNSDTRKNKDEHEGGDGETHGTTISILEPTQLMQQGMKTVSGNIDFEREFFFEVPKQLTHILSRHVNGYNYIQPVSLESDDKVRELFSSKLKELEGNDDNKSLHHQEDNEDDMDTNIEPELVELDEDEESGAFVFVPGQEPGWILNGFGVKTNLSVFFDKCFAHFRRNGWKPDTVQRLPLPVAYQNIENGKTGNCFVLSIEDPFNFNIMFEDNTIIDYLVKIEEFQHFFIQCPKTQKPYSFKNSLELLHGMESILWSYKTFMDGMRLQPDLESKSLCSINVQKLIDYKIGDLVVVVLQSRLLYGYEATKETIGCRAVVTSVGNIKGIPQAMYCSTYLLDYGQDIPHLLVSSIVPLPRAFSCFPPLAVNCSLHGVPDKDFERVKRMGANLKRLVKPDLGRTLYAEFKRQFSDTAEDEIEIPFPSNWANCFIDDIYNNNTFSVELYAYQDNYDSDESLSSDMSQSSTSTLVNITQALLGSRGGVSPQSMDSFEDTTSESDNEEGELEELPCKRFKPK